jgi:Rap/ran-GAP
VKAGSTGETSVYAKFQNFEVMYHVSTLLPYDSVNMQQLERMYTHDRTREHTTHTHAQHSFYALSILFFSFPLSLYALPSMLSLLYSPFCTLPSMLSLLCSPFYAPLLLSLTTSFYALLLSLFILFLLHYQFPLLF